jgi:hypothetical protein
MSRHPFLIATLIVGVLTTSSAALADHNPRLFPNETQWRPVRNTRVVFTAPGLTPGQARAPSKPVVVDRAEMLRDIRTLERRIAALRERRRTERTRITLPARVPRLAASVLPAAELDADLEVIGVVGAGGTRTTLVVRDIARLPKVEHGGDAGQTALFDGLTRVLGIGARIARILAPRIAELDPVLRVVGAHSTLYAPLPGSGLTAPTSRFRQHLVQAYPSLHSKHSSNSACTQPPFSQMAL